MALELMNSPIVKQLKTVKGKVLHLAEAGMPLQLAGPRRAPAGPRRQGGRFGPVLKSSHGCRFLWTSSARLASLR